MSEWWSFDASTVVASIAGAVFGTAVGLLGAAAGVLAPRGMARRLVIGAFVTALGAGIAVLSAGVFALTIGQPHHVWFGLALFGALTTAITGGLLPVVMTRYREADVRKLDAAELRRT